MSETSQTPGKKPNPFEQWVVAPVAEESSVKKPSAEQERVAIETLLTQIPFQPDKEVALLQKAVEETTRCMYRFTRENNPLAAKYFDKWRQSLEKKLQLLHPAL